MLDIEAFLVKLDPKTRVMIDRLRTIAASSNPSLIERIKWNAPSFASADDDRITLGVERKGGVRLVLHRGAKPSPTDGFVFEDPDKLATWPAPDRGVVVFRDPAALERAADRLTILCRRWIDHVDRG